jgi:hypothetical protein
VRSSQTGRDLFASAIGQERNPDIAKSLGESNNRRLRTTASNTTGNDILGAFTISGQDMASGHGGQVWFLVLREVISHLVC